MSLNISISIWVVWIRLVVIILVLIHHKASLRSIWIDDRFSMDIVEHNRFFSSHHMVFIVFTWFCFFFSNNKIEWSGSNLFLNMRVKINPFIFLIFLQEIDQFNSIRIKHNAQYFVGLFTQVQKAFYRKTSFASILFVAIFIAIIIITLSFYNFNIRFIYWLFLVNTHFTSSKYRLFLFMHT